LFVDELEKGGSFPWTIGEFLLKRMAHGIHRAGPFFFAGDDDTPVEIGVV
jgi:hypothetical protein